MGSSHGPRTHAVLWSGVDTGGGGDWTGATRLHTMPDGRCMVPRWWPASFPSSCIRSPSQLPNSPFAPLQFVLVPARTNRIGPGHTYFCPLYPPARQRQPAGLVTVHLGSLLPAHAFSQSCFLVLFPSFLLDFPPESIIPMFTNNALLSHVPLNEQHQINYRASSCCIYVIEASRPPGPLLPSIGRCVIRNCVLHNRFVLFPCCLQPALVRLIREPWLVV